MNFKKGFGYHHFQLPPDKAGSYITVYIMYYVGPISVPTVLLTFIFYYDRNLQEASDIPPQQLNWLEVPFSDATLVGGEGGPITSS